MYVCRNTVFLTVGSLCVYIANYSHSLNIVEVATTFEDISFSELFPVNTSHRWGFLVCLESLF